MPFFGSSSASDYDGSSIRSGRRGSGGLLELAREFTSKKRRSPPATLLDRTKLAGGPSIVELGLPISPPIPIRHSSANLSNYNPAAIISVRSQSELSDLQRKNLSTLSFSGFSLNVPYTDGNEMEDYGETITPTRRYTSLPSESSHLDDFGRQVVSRDEISAIDTRLRAAEACLDAKRRNRTIRRRPSNISSIPESPETAESAGESSDSGDSDLTTVSNVSKFVGSSNDLGWGFPKPPRRERFVPQFTRFNNCMDEEGGADALSPWIVTTQRRKSLAFPSRVGSISSGYASSCEGVD